MVGTDRLPFWQFRSAYLVWVQAVCQLVALAEKPLPPAGIQMITLKNRDCSIITGDYAAFRVRTACNVRVVSSRCCARSSRCMSKAIRDEIFDFVRRERFRIVGN